MTSESSTENVAEYARRYWLPALVVLTAVVAYYPVLAWLVEVWGSPLQPFAGYLAPIITAALLYSQREELARLGDSGSNWGLAVLGVALGIYMVSIWMHINVAAAFSLILTIWALILLLAGFAAARATLFPVGFLFFMLPWAWVRDALTFPLRMFSTRIAAWLPMAMGIPTRVSGTDIWLGDSLIRVDLECSGLNYLISLLACALLLLYVSPTSRWRAAALLVAVLPLSVFANIIRIDLTILSVIVFGPHTAEGFWHTFTGAVVFVLVIVILLALEAVICRRPTGEQQSLSPDC